MTDAEARRERLIDGGEGLELFTDLASLKSTAEEHLASCGNEPRGATQQDMTALQILRVLEHVERLQRDRDETRTRELAAKAALASAEQQLARLHARIDRNFVHTSDQLRALLREA